MNGRFDPPLTVADLEATPDDGKRHELIEGQLYVSDSAYYLHQTILGRIFVPIILYLAEHPIGEIVPGIGVIFDDFSGVIPDLVFFTRERKGYILAGARLIGAPDIAIEILSPGASNDSSLTIRRSGDSLPLPHGHGSERVASYQRRLPSRARKQAVTALP